MLAQKLKPSTLDEFIGQTHILHPTAPLYQLIQKKEIPHLFFYGTPGTGKTTLVKIIADHVGLEFHSFNATSLKVEALRKCFNHYQGSLLKPLIFIDEIHRLSKTQQEVLLPVMENNSVVIVGASTENPFFTLTQAIRSRSFIFEFKSLTHKELTQLLDRAVDYLGIEIEDEARRFILSSSCGDARALLQLIDFASKVNKRLTITIVKGLRQTVLGEGSSSDDTHYDLASALIKSLRGSDIDASLYYLSRLIHAGEPVEFITRRLMIFASEDIGNANPNALNLAVNTWRATRVIGYPESRIILAQCVVYLASCVKSNASYCAINKALEQIENGKISPIPPHIKDHADNYLYPHAFGGWVDQTYLSDPMELYQSSHIGFEKTLDDWIKKIKDISKR